MRRLSIALLGTHSPSNKNGTEMSLYFGQKSHNSVTPSHVVVRKSFYIRGCARPIRGSGSQLAILSIRSNESAALGRPQLFFQIQIQKNEIICHFKILQCLFPLSNYHPYTVDSLNKQPLLEQLFNIVNTTRGPGSP